MAAALLGNPVFGAAALPRRLRPVLFARYGEGEAYGAHVDDAIMGASDPDGPLRTDVAVTLFLSGPDAYDGGELVVEPGVSEMAGRSVQERLRTRRREWVALLERDDVSACLDEALQMRAAVDAAIRARRRRSAIEQGKREARFQTALGAAVTQAIAHPSGVDQHLWLADLAEFLALDERSALQQAIERRRQREQSNTKPESGSPETDSTVQSPANAGVAKRTSKADGGASIAMADGATTSVRATVVRFPNAPQPAMRDLLGRHGMGWSKHEAAWFPKHPAVSVLFNEDAVSAILEAGGIIVGERPEATGEGHGGTG